jgi:hypothetical protein
MPRRKKQALDLTTDEAMRKLFPLPIRKKAKKLAQESGKKRP